LTRRKETFILGEDILSNTKKTIAAAHGAIQIFKLFIGKDRSEFL